MLQSKVLLNKEDGKDLESCVLFQCGNMCAVCM